jgi:hypothetical protein
LFIYSDLIVLFIHPPFLPSGFSLIAFAPSSVANNTLSEILSDHRFAPA